MQQITSIFTGWKKQCFGWQTDFAGAVDVTQYLWNTLGPSWYTNQRVVAFTDYLCKRLSLDTGIAFSSPRELLYVWSGRDYPKNVLIYVNDTLKLSIYEFTTYDLEYLFSREDPLTMSVEV
jgi:hypothetical protein